MIRPTIKQLEALHWVARLGSFQAAASRLHTTQSAVSKRIAELEAQSGQALFDRSRRTAQLTPAGQRMAAGAQEVLDITDRLGAELAEPESFEGTFRLGATELIGMTWLPRFLRRIRQAHPRMLLEIEVDHGGRLLDKLRQGHFDLALVPGPMWGRQFEAVALRSLPRSWMASPSLGLARRTMTLQELSGQTVISLYPDTVHAQLQSAWFSRAGFPLQHTVLANSFAVQGELVLAGVGIGQLSVQYYREALEAGRLVKLRVTPTQSNVSYFAVYRRNAAHRLAAPLARVAKADCDFGVRA